MCAPLVFVSSANAPPIFSIRPGFQVDASEMPTGKQADVTLPPAKLPLPRAPLGPSLTFKAGMPTRSIGGVVHMLAPASSATFSWTVIVCRSASIRASGSGVVEASVITVSLVLGETAASGRQPHLRPAPWAYRYRWRLTGSPDGLLEEPTHD